VFKEGGEWMTVSYVLVTAAYNEERFIENTIQSVIAQECRPAEWNIVSDGSTDGTTAIVERYAARHDFIHLVNVTDVHPRNFAAQVNAINLGIRNLKTKDFEYFGNLDADITIPPRYFSLLLKKFADNPRLGLGGGAIYEKSLSGEFKSRKRNSIKSVAHACQLFRRECFEAIGGRYFPMPYGAPDVYAEVASRMNSWEVTSFADLPVHHHRFTGSADHYLHNCFRQGKADYSLGTLPVFELIRLMRRSVDKPYVIGSIARLAGFGHSYWIRETRPVPSAFVQYIRKEQTRRIAALLWGGSRETAVAQH
jgi:glycosyltransferase involved in cell wall biosynthesis